MNIKSFNYKHILILILLFFFLFANKVIINTPNINKESVSLCAINLNYQNSKSKEVSLKLLDINADIFALLEWTGSNLVTEILKNNGYSLILDYPKQGTHGVAVFSKSNFNLNCNVIPSPISGPCQLPFATITGIKNKRNISILVSHIPPPVESCNEMRDMTISYLSDSLHLFLPNCNVVLGDLNILPWNKKLKKLISNQKLIDAYAFKNFLPGPTWRPISFLPAIARIDYILVRKGNRILNSKSISIPGSDHKAIFADILFN